LCKQGGLVQLTKVLAVEWARYNINVNAIAPGYIRTPLNEEFLYDDSPLYQKIISRVPLKKLCCVEDLQGVAVFLASYIKQTKRWGVLMSKVLGSAMTKEIRDLLNSKSVTVVLATVSGEDNYPNTTPIHFITSPIEKKIRIALGKMD
jgi:NAD(P)-dependent dehydrogenase (short-subunit alcohol dehydrogenase family)